MMLYRRSTALLAAVSLLSCLPANVFADLSCLTPRFNGQESNMDFLVMTDEYRLVAESTSGAKGDVVPVTLWLHSNLENPGWISLAASVCHDPDAVEIVGEPEFTDEFTALLSVGGVLYFPVDEYADPENHGGHGFLLVANLHHLRYNERFPSELPLPIGTVYYRLKGEPGDAMEISFCNGELTRHNAVCNTNNLHGWNDDRVQGWDFLSTENESGVLTVTEGPVTRPDRPAAPPSATVYPELPSDEEINFQVRIPAQAASPGATEVPIDVFVSADVASAGLMVPINFDERYLKLKRVEDFLPGGVNIINNDNANPGNDVNEGFVLIASAAQIGTRRLLQEGEEIRAATLYFNVLDAAADVAETSLTIERVVGNNRGHEIPYDPRIFVRVENGTIAGGGGETREQVAPISVNHGRLALQAALVTLGDVNFDDRLDVLDAIGILDFLFHGDDIVCQTAADVNGDDRVNIADPVGLLRALFRTSTGPPDVQVPCF